MKPVHIKTLMKMRIEQISEHERLMKDFCNKHGDLIDREKETVASYFEQEKIDEEWAEDFVKGLDNE